MFCSFLSESGLVRCESIEVVLRVVVRELTTVNYSFS